MCPHCLLHVGPVDAQKMNYRCNQCLFCLDCLVDMSLCQVGDTNKILQTHYTSDTQFNSQKSNQSFQYFCSQCNTTGDQLGVINGPLMDLIGENVRINEVFSSHRFQEERRILLMARTQDLKRSNDLMLYWIVPKVKISAQWIHAELSSIICRSLTRQIRSTKRPLVEIYGHFRILSSQRSKLSQKSSCHINQFLLN